MQRTKVSYILLGICFLFLLVCNILLPASSDDYGHALKCANGFQSAVESYFHWNGRLGELMLVSFAAAMPPLLFDVVNSLIGAAFLFLLYFLILGHFPKGRDDVFYFSLLILCILALTMFGSIFVWISGAVNYLWGFFLIALWWVPIRLYFADKNLKMSIWQGLLYGIMGIFAGWCSEQVGIMSILVAILLIGYLLIKDKKVPIWLLIGFVGFCVGFCVLYFCPGAQNRSNEYEDYRSIGELLTMGIVPLVRRCLLTIRFDNSPYIFNLFVLCLFLYKTKSLNRGVKWLSIALFVVFMAVELYCYYDKKFLVTSVLYLCSLLGLLLFAVWKVYEGCKKGVFQLDQKISLLYLTYILSLLSTIQLEGNMPERAKFAQSLLLVAAVIYIVEAGCQSSLSLKKGVSRVVYGLLILVSFSTMYAYWDWNKKMRLVDAEVEAQKNQGNIDVVISKALYKPLLPNIGDWANPGKNPDVWPNTSYAEHFGVDSFMVK